MESCDCSDTAFDITDVFYLEIFEQIFSNLNYYELAAVRLVCKFFNYASTYEFGKKSRLVVNPINLPELDNFMQKSSTNFHIKHLRLLNWKNDVGNPFDCTNLATLSATINDLEVVDFRGIDEKFLLQICGSFTSLTTFSFMNENLNNGTHIDAAYIIGHLCGRLEFLTLKIQNVTERLKVPAITTSLIKSLTISYSEHDVIEFEKSKLFAVIAAISKGLKHLSLDFWEVYWDQPGKYDDDAVVLLSELEWNLQSLELLIDPMDDSSRGLQKWIEKIGASLTEVTLHGNFLDLSYTSPEFYIFEWVCDNCPQLTKFMFVCKETECCEYCQRYEFDDKRLEKLKKLTHLKSFKAPSRLGNARNKQAIIESIQQLNSHLRHLEIAFDPYVQDEITDLGLIGHFHDLTNLKITRAIPQDVPIRDFMNQFFKNFPSLQVLSFCMLRYMEDDYNYGAPLKDNRHGADVRNLKQLRIIRIRNGHKYMGQWLSFELLAQMPGLQSITFINYKEEIQLSDIRRILQNCTHLTKLHFTDCKWAMRDALMQSQIIAALPYGRKCSIKINSRY